MQKAGKIKVKTCESGINILVSWGGGGGRVWCGTVEQGRLWKGVIRSSKVL
jgi:hypothetical protein